MISSKRQIHRERRRWRVRAKVHGTAQRPRLSVCFTGEHIYVQFIDDAAGRTLASTSKSDRSHVVL